MAEKHNIEDEYSQEALETAVEIMRVPGETRERFISPIDIGLHKIQARQQV